MQPTGTYKVFANGTEIMRTTLPPHNDIRWCRMFQGRMQIISMSVATTHGWTTYNGNIVTSSFIRRLSPIPSASSWKPTSLPNLRCNHSHDNRFSWNRRHDQPNWCSIVANGGSATFAVLPSLGYAVSQVTVDGLTRELSPATHSVT